MVTSAINITRGVPFDPQVAAAMREVRKQQDREQRAKELREHGRMLDEQAKQQRIKKHRAAKRRKMREIELAYKERARDRRNGG